MISYMKKYDIIYDIIMSSNIIYDIIWYHHVIQYHVWYHKNCFISHLISYMILYMILHIYNEIVYDIIVLALLALSRNYDMIYDIISFGMISYMISQSSMVSIAFQPLLRYFIGSRIWYHIWYGQFSYDIVENIKN